MQQRHTAAECLRSPLAETLPPPCQALKKGFGECRRGLLDMRKRFRGNMPASFRTLAEDAEAEGKGYQLYAGRPAFAGGRGETDGRGEAPRDWREEENERYRKELAAAAEGEAAKKESGKS